MSKFKFFIAIFALVFAVNTASAEVVGIANYKKIEAGYNYAKTTYKQIDDKILELQQFVIDKDKEFKAIESPIQKKNFEEKTQKDYKDREDAILKLKLQKLRRSYTNDEVGKRPKIKFAHGQSTT